MVAVLSEVAPIATPPVSWAAIAPQLILMVGGLVMLTFFSLVRGRLPKGSFALYTVVVASASLVSTIPLWNRVHNSAEGPASVVAGAVGLDGFGLFVTGVICIGVILAALVADDYLRREGLEGPEFYVLLLLSASGGVTMATANDLIVLFVGLEILSIAVYVLAALHSRRESSQEAGMKYFILGAFSSAFLLYGIALVYGATGSTNLADIRKFLVDNVLVNDGLLLAGFALLLVGFGFKVASAPFHMWTPDVYQGAPTPVTVYMAAAVKAAGFAGLLRTFSVTFDFYRDQWAPAVYVLAVLSLLLGSLFAIVQTNVKRMLAYSSIAHAGFILVAVQASGGGIAPALFYLAAYTFMTAGAFAVVTLVGREGDSRHHLDDYRGLSRTRPVLALAFAVFLLAQAGVPLTGGFVAKFYVISAAADNHNWTLAVIAMVSAVISAFLYLRIVGAMYFADEVEGGDVDQVVDQDRIRVPFAAGLAVTLALVGTLVLGILPGPVTDLVRDATPVLSAPPP